MTDVSFPLASYLSLLPGKPAPEIGVPRLGKRAGKWEKPYLPGLELPGGQRALPGAAAAGGGRAPAAPRRPPRSPRP